jgi:hypothetical protein
MKKLCTLLIVITMLFIFTVAAFAAPSITGTLLYRFDRTDKGIATNNSGVNFFRLNFTSDASFNDDKATAYLALQCQTYLPENKGDNQDAEDMFNWNIQNYGYTYSLNDRWDIGFIYDTEGVTLSSGQLASNWEWIHIGVFGSKNVIKLVGSPFNILNAGIYLEPNAKEYLVKGEFKIKGLKIGAGYTNAKKVCSGNYKYNVYTEILPTAKSRIYLDYISDGKYLLESSAGLGPITAKLIASNEDRTYLGNTLIATNTADFSLNYAFGKQSVIAGLILNTYYLFDSQTIYFPAIYSRYNFDKGYAGIKQDFDEEATHINLGYRFDGTNLLEGDYSLKTGKYWIAMAVYL